MQLIARTNHNSSESQKITRRRSRHELLYRLSTNKGAFVYYACPMLFDKTDLYEVEVDLDQLRLVDLAGCNGIYDDNDYHFIYFDDRTSDPIWKSEPHVGKAVSPEEFARQLAAKFSDADTKESQRMLNDLLTDLRSLGISEEAEVFRGDKRREIMSLTDE